MLESPHLIAPNIIQQVFCWRIAARVEVSMKAELISSRADNGEAFNFHLPICLPIDFCFDSSVNDSPMSRPWNNYYSNVAHDSSLNVCAISRSAFNWLFFLIASLNRFVFVISLRIISRSTEARFVFFLLMLAARKSFFYIDEIVMMQARESWDP